MSHPKSVMILLFATSILGLLSHSQLVTSQSVTTSSTTRVITSTVTLTGASFFTTTEMSAQNVRFDLTPRDFNPATGTFSLGYSETGTTPYYPSDYLCLMYDYFLLNATTSYEFKIHFDTQQGIPIHFLIMNLEQFNEFGHTNCGQGTFGWEVREFAPTLDTVWIVPKPGEYVLLFLSRQFIGGYVHLALQPFGQTIQNVTSTYASTEITQLVTTELTTSTLPATTPGATSFSENALLIMLIVLVTLAGMVGLRFRRRTRT